MAGKLPSVDGLGTVRNLAVNALTGDVLMVTEQPSRIYQLYASGGVRLIVGSGLDSLGSDRPCTTTTIAAQACLDSPWGVAWLPGSVDEFLYAELAGYGRVRKVSNLFGARGWRWWRRW